MKEKQINYILIIISIILLLLVNTVNDSVIILISIFLLIISFEYAISSLYKNIKVKSKKGIILYSFILLYLVVLTLISIYTVSSGKILIYNRTNQIASEIELFDSANKKLPDMFPHSLTFIIIMAEKESSLKIKYKINGKIHEEVIFGYQTWLSQKDIIILKE